MKILFKTFVLSQSTTITNTILSKYINLFWKNIFSKLHSTNNNMHLLIMVKIEFKDSSMGHRTLANLRKVNFNDKELFIEFLISRLGILADSYQDTPFSKITFSYIVKEGLSDESRLLLQSPVYEVTKHAYNNMQLPLTMDPALYGKLLGKEMLPDNQTRYIVLNNGHVFYIDVSEDLLTNNVHMQAPVDLKWIDSKISESIFKRVIGKNTIFIENGVVLVKSKELNAKPFKAVKLEKQLTDIETFMTIDIETVKIGTKLHPYLISGYSFDSYIHSYAADLSFESMDIMFKNFIKQIIEKGKVKVIYAHNLNFDGLLILKHLIKYEGAKVEPLNFNGKLISIKFIVGKGKNARIIIFKDSYLFLPNSLRKLCVAFSVPVIKSYFPFELSDINYKGNFPSYELFVGDKNKSDLSYQDYLLMKEKHIGEWNFKDEAIKYCKLDCKCLFDILVKFNELIFNEFKLNIHAPNTLTLPSLAMKIYKAHFMPKKTIYQILGNVETDIRESFTGGSVDVYKSTNNIWDELYEIYQRIKLYYYDVNSLYPFIMSSASMPTGKPVAF
jgi:hypothetical protein